MDMIQKGLEKARRREEKIGKKIRGKKMTQKMVAHGRPIERREVDRTTLRQMFASNRSA